MVRRSYAGGAPPTQLAAGITAGSTSFTVDAGSGYPTGSNGPFFVVINPETGSEEKVLCSTRAGNVFTVAGGGRGADSTVAVSHNQGAEVRHVFTATDADESNEHVNTDAGVHGVSGTLVGTTDAQTLTNKTISGASNTIDAVDQSSIINLLSDQADQDAAIAAQDAALAAHEADTSAHGVTGNVVGTTDAQTLTNKTLDGGSNTLSNIPASALVNSGWTSIGLPTGDWTGVIEARVVGGFCTMRVAISRGASGASGQVAWSVGSAFRPTQTIFGLLWIFSPSATCRVSLQPNGSVLTTTISINASSSLTGHLTYPVI